MTNENRLTSSRAKEKQPGLLNIKLEDGNGASVGSLSLLFPLGMPISKRLQ